MANEHFTYIPEWHPGLNRIDIHGEEHHHMSRVLRLKPGDTVMLVNGKGKGARGTIEEIGRNQTVCRTEEILKSPALPAVSVTLVVGLIRRNRWEWLLEKGVELGITRIIPLQSRYTNRETCRPERDMKIMISALKQCGRFTLPVLEKTTPFIRSLQDIRGKGIILHNEEGIPYLGNIQGTIQEVTLYTGPEGGFSEEEMKRAEQAGIQKVHMGEIRLRTETAAVCAASYFTYWR
jgi:16S rRNA (uracil1498-N3)-methyltransferase